MQVNGKNQLDYEGFRGKSPLDLGRRLYDPRLFRDVEKASIELVSGTQENDQF